MTQHEIDELLARLAHQQDSDNVSVPLPLPNKATPQNLCLLLMSGAPLQWSLRELQARLGVEHNDHNLHQAIPISAAWFKERGYDLHHTITGKNISFAFTPTDGQAAENARLAWMRNAVRNRSSVPLWMLPTQD
jgi:hypothetical protein